MPPRGKHNRGLKYPSISSSAQNNKASNPETFRSQSRTYSSDRASSDSSSGYSSFDDDSLLSLDEPCYCQFQTGDQVWVKTQGGIWDHGQVLPRPPKEGDTRVGVGLFYFVQCASKIRKYFAPFNGEMWPDTPRIAELVEQEQPPEAA